MFERALKDLAFVPRWCIVRKLRTQYVAEHMFFVAHYANDIAGYLGLSDETHRAVLQYALWHDVDEQISGDMPGPNKRALVLNRPFWNDKLSQFMDRIFGENRKARSGGKHHPDNAAIVKAVVKCADWLESAIESATELQMGNQNVLVHFIHDSEQAEESAKVLCDVAERPDMAGRLTAHIRAAIDDARTGQSPGPVVAAEMTPAVAKASNHKRT